LLSAFELRQVAAHRCHSPDTQRSRVPRSRQYERRVPVSKRVDPRWRCGPRVGDHADRLRSAGAGFRMTHVFLGATGRMLLRPSTAPGRGRVRGGQLGRLPLLTVLTAAGAIR
jgi:hypothetical protein